jgi:hypothetical protein
MEGGASYMRKSFVAPFVDPFVLNTISIGKDPGSPKGFYFLQGNHFFLVILMHIKGQLSQEKNFLVHMWNMILYI